MGAHINHENTLASHVGEAMDAIRRLVRVLRIESADAERATGLSGAQLFVLRQLIEAKAASINELASQSMTDQSSVSAVVSRLETKGLVKRAPSPTDARRVTVSITPDGLRVLQTAPPTVQTRLIRALHTMPEQALQSLAHELTQIVALLGAAHEPPTLFFEDDATGPR